MIMFFFGNGPVLLAYIFLSIVLSYLSVPLEYALIT